MPRKKKEEIIEDEILDKIEYLGLNLDKIPNSIQDIRPLEYRVPRVYDEKKYRQYKYISIEDIQILLSPTNRLDELSERYKKARPLYEYLDSKSEENVLKHATFLNMLKNMNIAEIKAMEEEQAQLSRDIPFKIRYQGNYLWQIYYSENTDQYFMIVPTEETNNSAFFYVLKKKLEKGRAEKIFVPISNTKHSTQFLRKSEFEDIENYLWLFTKEWPSVYEVYDKNDELSLQIIGETSVYGKIKTYYKIRLKTRMEANNFYKLIKVLFILQTELPEYYHFETSITPNSGLEFYLNGKKVEYRRMIDFIHEQYKLGLKRKKEVKSKIRLYSKKLKHLQQKVAEQEIEYLAKEKQISTFLECKKSFFGKFKYYFKYNKKNNKKMERRNEEVIEKEAKVKEVKKEKSKETFKKVYTLEELIDSYKELQELENKMKSLMMDVNALKLKNKNMAKKIENATKYIEEIDSHKKSIFEFWKYSNKDEVSVLPEGEQEEVNVVKRIEKTFDYVEDLEKLGQTLDKLQRRNLNEEDTDSVYIATTDVIAVLNKMKTNKITPEELERYLKDIKAQARKHKLSDVDEEDEYDIFGNIIEDSTKIKKINDKKHRELQKDKFSILEVNKNTKAIGYRITLQMILKNIIQALQKCIIPESLPVYQLKAESKINQNEINVFNINLENELKEIDNIKSDKISLFKVNIKAGVHGVGFTNIIFYDNKNKTLPVGMDLSTKMIVDISKLHLKLVGQKQFRVLRFEDEKDDFSEIEIKEINVLEYDTVELEDVEEMDEE